MSGRDLYVWVRIGRLTIELADRTYRQKGLHIPMLIIYVQCLYSTGHGRSALLPRHLELGVNRCEDDGSDDVGER